MNPRIHVVETSDVSKTAETSLSTRYRQVRAMSEKLAAPLAPEDQTVQIDWFASPTKWHLAHVTWFFETFVLEQAMPRYTGFHPAFRELFNSYYNSVGDQFPQQLRGTLSRPTVAEVMEYRRHVDELMTELLEGHAEKLLDDLADVVVLGLHHEQQHQELLVTDIKYVFAHNPIYPVYQPRQPVRSEPRQLGWIGFPSGVNWVGHDGDEFIFDNEAPRHRVFLEAFELASRPVTNGEYLEFIEDGGYEQPDHWLSLGWKTACEQGWKAPLYWHRRDDGWHHYTLAGLRKVEKSEPVCHVSYFEADAYARWADARLPTEQEWEIASANVPINGNLVDNWHFHPLPAPDSDAGPLQMFGDVWECTASHYSPYPGYTTRAGALGEYNGKFMCNQFVLRGGSCATPREHTRRTYRNFFPPHLRWQFQGFRLARDA